MRFLFVLCLAFFAFGCGEASPGNPLIFCPSISQRSLSAHHVKIRNFGHLSSSPAMARRVHGRMTNAERLARGLPPSQPVRRGSPTRMWNTQPSAGPIAQVKGNIMVTDAGTNQVLGYISKKSYHQELFQYSSPQDEALLVGVNFPTGSTSGTALDMYDMNSDLKFPFVGMINLCDVGSTVASGYFVGTQLATPYSGPQNVGNSFSAANPQFNVGSESAVWSIDLVTGSISVSWTNTQNSPSPVVVCHHPGDSMLMFTTDPNSLGQGAVVPVTLTFVQVI